MSAVAQLKFRLQALIAQISQLQAELDRLRGWTIERELGSPATAQQLAIIERVAGIELPADYRAFIELHNGWSGFSGEHDLLSAEQMTSGPMAESISETRELQCETDDPASDGFVIYASISGTDIAYIDRRTQRTDGTSDVVRWDPRMREYKRYPSFIAYLEGQVASLERRTAKERANLR